LTPVAGPDRRWLMLHNISAPRDRQSTGRYFVHGADDSGLDWHAVLDPIDRQMREEFIHQALEAGERCGRTNAIPLSGGIAWKKLLHRLPAAATHPMPTICVGPPGEKSAGCPPPSDMEDCVTRSPMSSFRVRFRRSPLGRTACWSRPPDLL